MDEISTMIFWQYDVTLTISLKLSLHVATLLAVNISGFSAKVFFILLITAVKVPFNASEVFPHRHVHINHLLMATHNVC